MDIDEWRENLNDGDEVIVGGATIGEFVRWHESDDERADVRIGTATVVVWFTDLSRPVSA